MSVFDNILGPPPTMLGANGVTGMAGTPALGTPRAKPVAPTPAQPKPPEPSAPPGPFDDLLTMPAPPMASVTGLPTTARTAMTQAALSKAARGMGFP